MVRPGTATAAAGKLNVQGNRVTRNCSRRGAWLAASLR
jgi:hypothetical protein